jgi:hypothetical protein
MIGVDGGQLRIFRLMMSPTVILLVDSVLIS